jgi:hypothetical protein
LETRKKRKGEKERRYETRKRVVNMTRNVEGEEEERDETRREEMSLHLRMNVK